ncbi:sugar-transfer associated ATP-grasp domain-containing protein [Sphingomonas sp.]|uniref:sugar-transfer associated ATP-grasp domain-containing protein n=1 Tax=Sphingomonas sp. TaxID=28214 RepID=UPI00286E323A|nr:sugar-transfer associated ATP-grasp domain-containing protein [Sphingomonas sp.]
MAKDPRGPFRLRGKSSYWIAGLPVARRNKVARSSAALDQLRHEYAAFYWASDDRAARLKAMLLAPAALVRDVIQYTARNGRLTSQRLGRSIAGQALDQCRVYARHGILPRWYYCFSLYEPGGVARARNYLTRAETKPAIFTFLNRGAKSRLGDKVEFARHCASHGVAHVPIVAAARDGQVDCDASALPPCDLFVKPIRGRGGKGAERWAWIADERGYRGPDGAVITAAAFLARLTADSAEAPRMAQPRAVNHPDMADLSNGALTTLRFLSCLDEQRRPVPIGAALRMAVGANQTVDNYHAGGIAAAIDLDTGTLGRASNQGHDVRLGWLTHHPDTKGRIEGRALPLWPQVMALVEQAHRAFDDHIVVGWDIAILADGPVLVEGNTLPDVDIMQRPLGRGLGDTRFVEMLLHHVRAKRESAGDR